MSPRNSAVAVAEHGWHSAGSHTPFTGTLGAELGLSSTSSAHFWYGSNRPTGEGLRNHAQAPRESVGVGEVLTAMDTTRGRQALEAGLCTKL